MSQYNWSWWFVLNIIVLTVGFFVAMVAKNSSEIWYAEAILTGGMISFVPCLYIGMKPGK